MHTHYNLMGATSVPPFLFKSSQAHLARTLREAVEIEVERLIEFLDGLEPDPDLEPYLEGSAGDDREGTDDVTGGDADDEPALGFLNARPARGVGTERIWHGPFLFDCEHTDCDDEDSDPAEASEESGFGDVAGMLEDERGEVSLGATEEFDQRLAWVTDGEGVDDGEASLGWSNNNGAGYYENQADSPRDDREEDHEREDDHAERFGIADAGGMAEQFPGMGHGAAF